ncbi:MAG: hypothetical protein IJM13_01640, partial [Lachnospiraceae bacterium]|nr:hypothetical protein [Lachnospiraceae bacterium]
LRTLSLFSVANHDGFSLHCYQKAGRLILSGPSFRGPILYGADSRFCAIVDAIRLKVRSRRPARPVIMY